MYKALCNTRKLSWFILFALSLLGMSCLIARQAALYEGATVTVLEIGTSLLDVQSFQISPNGRYIVMSVVEKKDDIVEMRLPAEAAEVARSQGKGKVQIIDLTTQTKLVEFALVEGHNTDHRPFDFSWSPNNDIVYYRNDGRPSIVKLDIATGQRTAYYFPYAGFNMHPKAGLIIGWGNLVEKSGSVEIYETVYTNKLVVVDPINMLIRQEIVFSDVPLVFEAVWGGESDEVLIRDGVSLYHYNLASGIPTLSRKLPYITHELEGKYNPFTDVFLLEESAKNSKRYLIYDPTIDCIMLEINVDIRLTSPAWHSRSQIIVLRTNDDRSVQLLRLEVSSLTVDIPRLCIK
jgi:hypothetical protein